MDGTRVCRLLEIWFSEMQLDKQRLLYITSSFSFKHQHLCLLVVFIFWYLILKVMHSMWKNYRDIIRISVLLGCVECLAHWCLDRINWWAISDMSWQQIRPSACKLGKSRYTGSITTCVLTMCNRSLISFVPICWCFRALVLFTLISNAALTWSGNT